MSDEKTVPQQPTDANNAHAPFAFSEINPCHDFGLTNGDPKPKIDPRIQSGDDLVVVPRALIYALATEAASACDCNDGDEHPLTLVFACALAEVTDGKGQERHGNGVDFLDQPWLHIARRHGIGFLTGQAEKKLGEATAHRDDWDQGKWEREMLGAINYLAMAVLYDGIERHIAAAALEDGDDDDADEPAANRSMFG